MTNEDSETKIELTPNAIRVLEKRYLRKDDTGKVIETPSQMFRRIARDIAKADLIYDTDANIKRIEDMFYEVMAKCEFIPNSPTLMNAGAELQQLSACFVLPVEDSMESIFDTLRNTALIHKSGGGTGFSFSRLRPKDDIVRSTKGVSSGPVSFIKVFDAATEAIKQGGTRRGANMAILRVDHPDILEFITAKSEHGNLPNFNISVGLTEKFMQALERNEEYELVNPRTNKITEKKDARKVWDLLVEMAWRNGEPGIVFLDKLNKDNPTPELGEIESTNPCGEQPLLPYESCNLGSINLAKMVDERTKSIDFEKLARTVKIAVHFLDNVIDRNRYPVPIIGERTKGNRKIGLGVMGFADMLIQLGIPYDSEEATRIGGKIAKFIQEEATKASVELAKTRGVFPNFKHSIYYPDGPEVRNATRTTIAPTGTISIIAGCSSGVEPIFAIAYVRHVMDKDELVEVNPYFVKIAEEYGFYSDELMIKIAKKGSIQDMEDIPSNVRRLFVTAHDITPEHHIRMQAVFQKYVDNAVSKTVNFPYNAVQEDIEKVYWLAYKLGCKGVTVYRDRSREEQVLTVGIDKRVERQPITPRVRPSVTRGVTEKIRTGCGNLYVTINEDTEGLCEVFAQMGKSGGCAASQSEATSRLISLALRSGIDIHSVIKQLKDIRCPSPLLGRGGMVLSCPDAIAKVLERYLKRKDTGDTADFIPRKVPTLEEFVEDYDIAEIDIRNVVGVCPDCGCALVYESGCVVCRYCGYSKCG